jgi:hypothetical protein
VLPGRSTVIQGSKRGNGLKEVCQNRARRRGSGKQRFTSTSNRYSPEVDTKVCHFERYIRFACDNLVPDRSLYIPSFLDLASLPLPCSCLLFLTCCHSGLLLTHIQSRKVRQAQIQPFKAWKLFLFPVPPLPLVLAIGLTPPQGICLPYLITGSHLDSEIRNPSNSEPGLHYSCADHQPALGQRSRQPSRHRPGPP